MKPGDRVEIYDKPKAYTQRPLRTHKTTFVHYAGRSLALDFEEGLLCVFRTTPLSGTFTRPLRDVVV